METMFARIWGPYHKPMGSGLTCPGLIIKINLFRKA